MAKKPLEEGLRDPFRKWSGSFEELASINSPLSIARDNLNQLTKQLTAPGLSREARAILLKSIAEAKAELRKVERESKKSVQNLIDSKRIQADILFKLSAIRAQMLKKDLSQDVLTTLMSTERQLEKLLTATKNLESLDDINSLLKDVADAQAKLENLPADLAEAFDGQDEILNRILRHQEEARKFLQEQRNDIKRLGRNAAKWLVNKGMSVADKLGFGPFTVGNVIRGLGVGGSILKAGYKGAKYVGKTISAIRAVSKSPEEILAGGSSTQSIAEKFSEYVAHTRLFQRRMMRSMDKQEKESSKDSSMLGSILSTLGSFFGAGGLIRGLFGKFTGLFGKGLPILAGLLKGAARILGPLGALWGAFQGGKFIGDKIYSFIEEPLSKAIDYFFLKDPNTGRTGLQQSIDDALKKGQDTYQSAVDAIGRAKKAAIDRASSWISSGKDVAGRVMKSASDAVSSASQAVGVRISNVAPSTATSLGGAGGGRGFVNPGMPKPKSISERVSDWIGSLFNKSGNVNVDGLNPEMQKNMIGMAQEYYQLTGKRLNINSAYRSPEHQAHLYRTLPKGQAAPPGRSLHEYGFAFDTNSAQGNELARLGLLNKYGFSRPISKEPWHIQPAGMTLAAAKAGIYSADRPVNQGAKASPVSQEVSPASSVPSSTPTSTASAVDSSATAKGGGTMQPSTKVSVSDIPTYYMSDGLMLAMNIGVAA